MKKVKRWRYYCGFCKKSGASGHHMANHEAHCCRNPDRVCRMCKKAELVQQDMPTLRAALASGGLDELRRVAGGEDIEGGCPACILATLMQDRAENPPDADGGGWIEFDYKAAAETFWKIVNDAADLYY